MAGIIGRPGGLVLVCLFGTSFGMNTFASPLPGAGKCASFERFRRAGVVHGGGLARAAAAASHAEALTAMPRERVPPPHVACRGREPANKRSDGRGAARLSSVVRGRDTRHRTRTQHGAPVPQEAAALHCTALSQQRAGPAGRSRRANAICRGPRFSLSSSRLADRSTTRDNCVAQNLRGRGRVVWWRHTGWAHYLNVSRQGQTGW